MTEDDERMERASRIRQMREGPTDEDSDDEQKAETDDGASETEPSDEAGTDESETGARSESADEPVVETSADAEAQQESVEEGDEESPDAEADAEDDGTTGLGLVDPEEIEAAQEDAPEAEDAAAAGASVGVEADVETTAETVARVLEFSLGEEQYCLDIDYIEEIVKRNTVTRVPNTPDYVAGVVDLRGQITTILNPKHLIGVEGDGQESLIIVFDAEAFGEQGNLGWLVDDVRQVTPIVEDEINEPPIEEKHINGVIDREGEDFVIWTDPEVALETDS